MLQFLIIFDEGKNTFVCGKNFFHSHDVRNIVLERRKARPSYFPLVRNQLDPFVSLEREFRVEKSDTRADYVYVERISNGQTDPIRRQVGLPKFSIMERFTSLNFSTFPRFSPPFFFFFFFSNTFIVYAIGKRVLPNLQGLQIDIANHELAISSTRIFQLRVA